MLSVWWQRTPQPHFGSCDLAHWDDFWCVWLRSWRMVSSWPFRRLVCYPAHYEWSVTGLSGVLCVYRWVWTLPSSKAKLVTTSSSCSSTRRTRWPWRWGSPSKPYSLICIVLRWMTNRKILQWMTNGKILQWMTPTEKYYNEWPTAMYYSEWQTAKHYSEWPTAKHYNAKQPTAK